MRHPFRSRLSRLAAGVVVACGAVVASSAAPAAALPEGVYSVPYASMLFGHRHHETLGPFTYVMTYEQWSAAGFPTPVPAPTEYARHPWSSRVHAWHSFDGQVLGQALTFEDWQRAGSPAPQVRVNIPGTVYVTVRGGGPEIIASLRSEGAVLTPDQWASAGYPAPIPVSSLPLRLTWEPTIVELVGRTARVVDHEEWVERGEFTVYALPMLPGDSVCRVGDTTTLRHQGISHEGDLTYEQWVAAGFPQPTGTC